MITKAKKVQFTTSDGINHDTIEDAKCSELYILIGKDNQVDCESAVAALVQNPRETIAILRLGLPRKPRTVKAKTPRAKKAAASVTTPSGGKFTVGQ